MNAESVRSFLQAQPFVPFEVRMTDGDKHRVRHPEMAMLAGGRLIIYSPENDRVSMVSLLHINGIDVAQFAHA